MGVRSGQEHDQKGVAVTIGHAIQAALDQRDLSRAFLAEQIGIDKATLGRWIRGERDPYSKKQPGYREVLDRIDQQLGTGLVTLYDELTGYAQILSAAGRLIQDRLGELGMSASQLSKASGVSAYHLSGILTGARGPDSPRYAPQLITLARVLDIDATQLLAAGGVEGEAATVALMWAIIATASPDRLDELNAALHRFYAQPASTTSDASLTNHAYDTSFGSGPEHPDERVTSAGQ